MNKLLMILTATIIAFSAVSPVHADADDNAWILKCISDNKDAKVDVAVVEKYCRCMNNKMSSDETLSVSAWEKDHPKERAACDKESGWK